MVRPLVVMLMILACYPVTTAQDYTSRLISIQEGLPARQVHLVQQDRNGLIWIATANGICSYDGYQVIIRQPAGIFENTTDIDFDLQNEMYITTGNGTLYRHAGAGFEKVDLASGEIRDGVTDIAFDQSGNCWLAHGPSNHLFCFDAAWQYRFRVPLTNDTTTTGFHPGSYRLEIDMEGNIYTITSRTTFAQFDADGNRLADFHLVDTFQRNDYLLSVFSDPQGPLALARHGRLMRPDRHHILYPHEARIPFQSEAWLHSSGILYAGNVVGDLTAYSQDNQVLHHVPLRTEEYPDQAKISWISEDSLGGLWIASEIGAITTVQNPQLFEVFRLDGITQGKGIRSMIDGGHFVYFSTDSYAFVRLDSRSGEIRSLSPVARSGVGHFHQIAMRDSILYTGSHVSYSLAAGKLLHADFQDDQKNARFDRRGRFITCGTSKFMIFDEPRGKVLLSINTPHIRSMAEGPDGDIWLCGYDGVFRIREADRVIHQYLSENTEARVFPGFTTMIRGRLPADVAYEMLFTDDTMSWLATSAGLLHLDIQGGDYSLFSAREGLPIDVVYSILPEGDSALWLGTGAGLCRFDLGDSSIITYTTADGIAHNEFNATSTLISQDGYYYMGGINGITRFRPEVLRAHRLQKNQAPLMLRELAVFDGQQNWDYPIDSIMASGRLVLRPRDKILSVSVALADYRNPGRNMFSFFLEGFDSDWTEPDPSHRVRYNSLSPGEYTLRVRGRHGFEGWSSKTLAVPIVVRQAFTRSAWFPILIALGLSGLVYIVLNWRYKQRLRLEQLRTRISSDLHDEVGGVLSGLAMQMDLLSEEVPQMVKARVENVARGSRNAASRMRDVIWAVDASRDYFEDLEERMKAFAIEMLSPLQIAFYFHTESMDPQLPVDSIVRQNVLFIFKEAINNIAKHAQATEVHVDIDPVANGFRVFIRDNGKGLPVDGDPTQGNGLRYMRMRAERIGGDLTIRSGEGVEIRLVVLLR